MYLYKYQPCCAALKSNHCVCFAGGFPYELSEGDIICVFSQWVLLLSFPVSSFSFLRFHVALISLRNGFFLCFQVWGDCQYQPCARQEDGEVEGILFPVLRGPEEYYFISRQPQRHKGMLASLSYTHSLLDGYYCNIILCPPVKHTIFHILCMRYWFCAKSPA